jgi:hypothetical protein
MKGNRENRAQMSNGIGGTGIKAGKGTQSEILII